MCIKRSGALSKLVWVQATQILTTRGEHDGGGRARVRARPVPRVSLGILLQPPTTTLVMEYSTLV